MPLQTENVEIVFEGLDQKTDSKMVKAGAMTRAVNVEFDKSGVMNKRRGYLRYRFDGGTQMAALGETMETQANRVVAHRDELLVFGVGWLWAIADKGMNLDGSRSAAKRGRLSPGNVVVETIAGAPQGDG